MDAGIHRHCISRKKMKERRHLVVLQGFSDSEENACACPVDAPVRVLTGIIGGAFADG